MSLLNFRVFCVFRGQNIRWVAGTARVSTKYLIAFYGQVCEYSGAIVANVKRRIVWAKPNMYKRNNREALNREPAVQKHFLNRL